MINLKILKVGHTNIVVGNIPAENILPLAHDTAELFKYAEPYSKSQHRLSAQFGKHYTFGSKTYPDRTNHEDKEIILKLFNLAKSIAPHIDYNGIHINYYQPELLEANHNSMYVTVRIPSFTVRLTWIFHIITPSISIIS